MGGAAALETEDMAFTQYREPGILMWRDFGMQVLRVTSCAPDAVGMRECENAVGMSMHGNENEVGNTPIVDSFPP